ncbi:MAG: AAA family ATPase [Planctomycetes bacterium]|nr:AAA family ATPase [Planctomycetota bacterium]
MSRLGVTVGKFYPLHLGHAHLLREASRQVDRLVVVVGFRPGQELPGELRAGWIRELFPEAEVVLTPEDLPEAPEPWAARTLELLGGRRPDLAFTSEAYGEAWAAALGARHVGVDPPRATFPISGTALRADLAAHWPLLSGPAKAHFARRVVVLGVESSGTTTLARALAQALETPWVPEYGRAYWEGRASGPDPERWTPDEFLHIARAQASLEDALARRANRALVCDTDPLATAVWARRYLGRPHAPVARFAARRAPALYLLTAPDFGFVQDGTRESEAFRAAMHAWFVEALEASGVPWRLVEGPPEERLEAARAAVAPLLEFAPLADPTAPVGHP